MLRFENAALVLRTRDLTQGETTNVGTCDEYNTNFTWRNINLRSLLGTMYDKYEKFNLCLHTVASTGADEDKIGFNRYDRIVQIQLSGLSLLNQTYDVVHGCNTGYADIGTFEFSDVKDITAIQPYYSSCVTFDKRYDVANINLRYQRLVKNIYGSSDVIPNDNIYPEMVFMFNIYGIPNEGTSYGERLEITPPFKG